MPRQAEFMRNFRFEDQDCVKCANWSPSVIARTRVLPGMALRRRRCRTSVQRNDWTVYKNNTKSGDSHDRTDYLFPSVALSARLAISNRGCRDA
jgi:hypothetical protein